jgi:hypothetical protein
MNRLTIFMISTMLAVSFLLCPGSAAHARTYDELAGQYQTISRYRDLVAEFEGALVSKAQIMSEKELWLYAMDMENPAGQRASNGLSLIKKIFPEGNPANWHEISGFFMPGEISRPLAAFDALYFTCMALVSMDEPEADWLARQLLSSLRGSSRGTFLAIRTAPKEYLFLTSRISASTGPAPVGGWPQAEISGQLPFARSPSSFTTQEYAMMKKMIFLNASGQPVPGTGPYAWDRKNGRIHRVAESRDDLLWWWLPGR